MLTKVVQCGRLVPTRERGTKSNLCRKLWKNSQRWRRRSQALLFGWPCSKFWHPRAPKKRLDHVYFAHPTATNQNLDSITGYAMKFTAPTYPLTHPHTIIPDTLSPILHFWLPTTKMRPFHLFLEILPKPVFQTKPAYPQLIRVTFWKIQHASMKDEGGLWNSKHIPWSICGRSHDGNCDDDDDDDDYDEHERDDNDDDDIEYWWWYWILMMMVIIAMTATRARQTAALNMARICSDSDHSKCVDNVPSTIMWSRQCVNLLKHPMQ